MRLSTFLVAKRDNRRWATYYVHPVTGILCSNYEENEAGHKAAKIAKAQAEKAKVFREHDKNTHLYFVEGVWYEYTLKDIPAPYVEYVCPHDISPTVWDTMTLADREREGRPRWTRPKYTPIDGPRVNYGSRHYGYWYSACPKDRYYSSFKLANRKTLRQHDLLGSNEFKEVERELTNRERRKY